MNHVIAMRRCLELAERGRGYVGSNPMVGAVLVRDGSIIAEGYHSKFGSAHAEQDLLQKFEQRINSTDVLYVNLEPCCHHGKTPPCTDLLLERSVKKVVYGMHDPNPLVGGKGIEMLRAAEVEVTGPILRAQCERLNRGFVSLQTKGRPWITLKSARMRDGRTASDTGARLMITTSEQDAWSHQFLRARHDAILVGVGTILADDPLLTVRLNTKSDQDFTQPVRIILDPNLRISLDVKVVSHGTVVVTAEDASHPRARELIARGVRVVTVPLGDGGYFDWTMLWQATVSLGIASMLVEGGAKTWAAFRESGCVDEEVVLGGGE